MSFCLGLTGSIGMGKSTTAEMFADRGCAVWNADETVHRLYAQGGAAVEPVGRLIPNAIVDQAIDRAVLRGQIANDPNLLKRIEAIVHPLVQADREMFKSKAEADVLVFDIPLLFETSAHEGMDATVCVFVDAAEQRRRVLARGTMTATQFEQILAKQMPIADKLSLADYRIETDTLEHATSQVAQILQEIRQGKINA